MMFDLLTVGDIKLDAFISIPEKGASLNKTSKGDMLCIPNGVKNIVTDTDLQVAGSAPNVAIGVSKMRKQTSIYAQMGDSIFHEMAIAHLKKYKVDASLLRADPKLEHAFAAVLNYRGESTQLVTQTDVAYRLPKKLPSIEWFHLSELGSKYKALYGDLVAYKKSHGTRISFNPGLVQINERSRPFLKLIKYTDILFVNWQEAHMTLRAKKKLSPKTLLTRLHALGANYVVVTDGRNGAYAFDGSQLDFAPMFPGPRVEATGAGDAFTSGFLGAVMHGKHHDEALKWAAVNAASAVFHVGPTAGLLSHTQIKKRLKANPSYKTIEIN
jgi:sugar/nucleoside kinase (ribokinase family)